VLSDYAYALDVLDKYDHQILEIEATSPKQLFQITYDSAMQVIRGLKDKFGGSSLFGNEKGENFNLVIDDDQQFIPFLKIWMRRSSLLKRY